MLLFATNCEWSRPGSYPHGSMSEKQKRDMALVIFSLVVVNVVVVMVVDVVVCVVLASSRMACTVALWPSTWVFQRLQSWRSESPSQGHMRTLLPARARSGASMQKPCLCWMRPEMPSNDHCWLSMLAVHGWRWMPPPWLRYSTESMQRPCLVPMMPDFRSMYHCWLSVEGPPHSPRCSCCSQSRQMPWRFLIWKVMVFLPGRPDTKASSSCRMNSTWFFR
mmetsp:Transcript_83385/g.269756  ORF Transcript_83385/g.269756 Transcript_83385/m.269756 type:complete len:221 (-) Transcript_83385:1022-1684(-)